MAAKWRSANTVLSPVLSPQTIAFMSGNAGLHGRLFRHDRGIVPEVVGKERALAVFGQQSSLQGEQAGQQSQRPKPI